MPNSVETKIDRPGRDNLAAEARELWNQPKTGQARIRLAESQVDAINKIFMALTIYTPASSTEPIGEIVGEIKEFLFSELGAALHTAERAAVKRSQTLARRRAIREAEAKHRTTTHSKEN
ncbi:hypothetical protein ACWDA3_25925 [Nonomuraea rubra]